MPAPRRSFGFLVIAVILVLAAGLYIVQRNRFTPASVSLKGWEWRRFTADEKKSSITGVLQIEGQTSHEFTLLEVECSNNKDVKGTKLPLDVERGRDGSYRAGIDLSVPAIGTGNNPLELWINYRVRKSKGRMGPIVLLP